MNLTECVAHIKRDVSIEDILVFFINIPPEKKLKCPFHKEKTASFTIYNNKYHCFGCGVHGNAIDFVMAYRHTSFIDSVTLIAELLQLSISKIPPKLRLRGSIMDYELICHNLLFNSDRLYSIASQRLTEFEMRKYKIGVDNGRVITRYPNFTLNTGIVRNGRSIFSHRLLFPIKNRAGHTLGFTARTYIDASPKYLNSYNSAKGYDKARDLWGINLLEESSTPVITEGVMDAIAINRLEGYIGLSINGASLKLTHLLNINSRAIIMFDNDLAGRRATLNALKLCLQFWDDIMHIAPNFVIYKHYTTSKDPFDLYRDNKLDLLAILQKSYSIYEYLVYILTKGKKYLDAKMLNKIISKLNKFLESEVSNPQNKKSIYDKTYALLRNHIVLVDTPDQDISDTFELILVVVTDNRSLFTADDIMMINKIAEHIFDSDHLIHGWEAYINQRYSRRQRDKILSLLNISEIRQQIPMIYKKCFNTL